MEVGEGEDEITPLSSPEAAPLVSPPLSLPPFRGFEEGEHSSTIQSREDDAGEKILLGEEDSCPCERDPPFFEPTPLTLEVETHIQTTLSDHVVWLMGKIFI